MRVFVGNHLRLEGRNRHGKNRIRENGDMWEVIQVMVKIHLYFPLRVVLLRYLVVVIGDGLT